jgi:hypothetical protein
MMYNVMFMIIKEKSSRPVKILLPLPYLLSPSLSLSLSLIISP